MPSRRTPIARDLRRVITPRAIEIFARLRQLPYGGERWWEVHSELHDELHAKPWQWPCVASPHERGPYPEGCHAARQWERERAENPEPVRLWLELQRAVKAAQAPAAAPAPSQPPRRTRSPRALRNPPP
jgi:hypothetical protein